MPKRLLFAAALACCALAVCAQKNTDLSTLSFDENISQPAPHNKGIADLRTHIKEIEASLIRKGYACSAERNGEVVKATIPCASLFAPNDTQLMPSATSLLEPFAQYAKYPTMYKVIVAVFADDTGDDLYSDTLTSDRANAIFSALCTLSGSNGESIIPYGMAKDMPVVPNSSYSGRAQNRRVEIRIVPNWQMVEMARSGKLKR